MSNSNDILVSLYVARIVAYFKYQKSYLHMYPDGPQYIYYPDEGHVFTKLENRKDSFERAINWIGDTFN